jgi:hypothetical protein
MPGWLEELWREAKAIASVPFLFAAVVLVAAVAIWGALHWSYRATMSAKDRHIAMLERRVAEYRESVGGATPDEAKHRIETLRPNSRPCAFGCNRGGSLRTNGRR